VHALLDPRTLAALGDLQLAARAIVDGVMYGVHRSRLPGSGLEFSQYRSYQPGDDLRRVDWKLFGRSDRYFVRESETETTLVVRLAVDATASMAQAEEGGVSRLAYARLVTAALAFLAHRQGDAVGLLAVSDDRIHTLEPRQDPQQLGRALHLLESLAPAGRWPAWPRLEPAFLGGVAAGRRGITVLVSDMHERAEEIRAVAARLAALRHDVLALHLVGPTETDFPYAGPVTFEELETGRRVEVDAARARAAYLEGTRREHEELRRALEGRGVAYARLSTAEPLDAALIRALRARARLAAPA
jgi:uncharacterized protein (DUF58 family)